MINTDTATRTRHQGAMVAADRRTFTRNRATRHGHRWIVTGATAAPDPRDGDGQRIPFIGPMPRPNLGRAVALDVVAPPERIGGAPDPTLLRQQPHVVVESPTWGPMVETHALQLITWHSYCAAWLATPEGADEYATARLDMVECEVLADRERAALRAERRRALTAKRNRAMRARKRGDAPDAPLTADEWALAHGVVLPTVDGHHTALEVSRENRRARPSRVPAVDIHGQRI